MFLTSLILWGHHDSIFAALDKAEKTKTDLREGPVVDFFRDSINDYSLINMAGFRPMYNGALYSRRFSIENDQDEQIYGFVFMNQCTIPAEEKMIGRVQQVLRESNAPDKEALKKKAQELLNEMQLSSGQQYLGLAYGRVPETFLKKNAHNIEGLLSYGAVLNTEIWKNHPGFGLSWCLRYLPYNGSLPGKELLQFKGLSAFELDEAKSIVDAFYDAVKLPLHVTNLFDNSSAHEEFLVQELITSLSKQKTEEQSPAGWSLFLPQKKGSGSPN